MFRGSWETGGRVEEGGKGQDNCMGVEALRNIILKFLSARLLCYPPPFALVPEGYKIMRTEQNSCFTVYIYNMDK